MKTFLFTSFKFFSCFFIVIAGLLLFSNARIDKGNYFSVKPGTSYLVLGPSQPECAFNDSLIPGLSNFSQSGDSYFYTYYKAKKLLQNNESIQAVFIEFSNNLIDSSMDDLIWSDRYLSYKFQKYAAVLEPTDLGLLVKHNWRSVLNAQTIALKNNLLFLSKRRNSFIQENNWGGYLFNNRQNMDSLIKAMPAESKEEIVGPLSATNISYLVKTINYCKEKGRKVYLIRSPIHHKAVEKNEKQFQAVLKTQLTGTELLDFKNYPLSDDQFGDFDHLNYHGANAFSLFFSDFLKTNRLDNAAVQAYIATTSNTLKADTVSIHYQ